MEYYDQVKGRCYYSIQHRHFLHLNLPLITGALGPGRVFMRDKPYVCNDPVDSPKSHYTYHLLIPYDIPLSAILYFHRRQLPNYTVNALLEEVLAPLQATDLGAFQRN